MSTVRVDIIGSTFTRGVFSNRHDTATVHAMLTNEGLGPLFNNTQSDYQRATNAYIAEEGLYYPTVFAIQSDGTNDEKTNIGPQLLPILKIRAQRYGPTKMLVTALYQRTPGTDQPDDPFARATFRPLDETLTVYRHNFTIEYINNKPIVTENVYEFGLPAGDFIDPDGVDNIESKSPARFPEQWPVSGLRVFISLQLAGPPNLVDLETFRNTINNNNVLFLGSNFPAFTVYFEGYELDYVGDDSFSMLLLFKLLAPGWINQKVVKVFAPDPEGILRFASWATETHPFYTTSDFSKFPI